MSETLKKEGHEFRSGCSIARLMELLGDKWTLLVARDLMWHQKHTFKSLQESDERIPTNLLSERLQRLIIPNPFPRPVTRPPGRGRGAS